MTCWSHLLRLEHAIVFQWSEQLQISSLCCCLHPPHLVGQNMHLLADANILTSLQIDEVLVWAHWVILLMIHFLLKHRFHFWLWPVVKTAFKESYFLNWHLNYLQLPVECHLNQASLASSVGNFLGYQMTWTVNLCIDVNSCFLLVKLHRGVSSLPHVIDNCKCNARLKKKKVMESCPSICHEGV